MIIDLSFIESGDRSAVLVALGLALNDKAHRIRTLEETLVKVQGGNWNPENESDYRALRAAASFINMVVAGARALKIEAERSGDGRRRSEPLPQWILALADQSRAELLLEVSPSTATVSKGADYESAA